MGDWIARNPPAGAHCHPAGYLVPRCNVGPMDRKDMGLMEPCDICPFKDEYRQEVARVVERDAGGPWEGWRSPFLPQDEAEESE